MIRSEHILSRDFLVELTVCLGAINFKKNSSVQLEKPFIEEFNKWTNYQSIHSVFQFIEDHFSHFNYIFHA